jgi:hypothetical protein
MNMGCIGPGSFAHPNISARVAATCSTQDNVGRERSLCRRPRRRYHRRDEEMMEGSGGEFDAEAVNKKFQ